MIAGQGLFQLTTRSETFRLQATLQTTGETRNGKSAVKLPAGTQSGPMKDFWQSAAKTASERLPSADTLQHLEQAARSDNKEVSAQKMQQAKAKLQSLRLQAQMAAASGDKQTLKRIAQEVAAAARDVTSAARDLAGGVAGSVTGSDAQVGTASAGSTGAASPSGEAAEASDDSATADKTAGAISQGQEMPDREAQDREDRDPTETGHHGPAEATKTAGRAVAEHVSDEAIYTQDAPENGDKADWGQKALCSLNDDASAALAQARGLLAFLATAARAKRTAREDGDDKRFFDELNRVVDAAEQDMRAAFGNATQEILANRTQTATDTADSGLPSVSLTQVTVTQVTMTATLLNITA